MYQKYTTEGFLVSSRGSGEADRMYLFYTKEFGMVLTHATSVRASKSKLRPHVVTGASLSLTLLRSKQRWKLVEVVTSGVGLTPKSAGYKTFVQILSVLKSLVVGEERNESLFGAISDLYQFLISNSDDRNLGDAECLSMIKILHSLGYSDPKVEMMGDDNGFNDETLQKIKSNKQELISGINKALAATGL